MTDPKSASEWALFMAELRQSKPRPLAKLYGKTGPTPAQLVEYKARESAWNSAYRYASKMQKLTLATENRARRG
jgi:hypothetical protein